jgi:hypothetical protein
MAETPDRPSTAATARVSGPRRTITTAQPDAVANLAAGLVALHGEEVGGEGPKPAHGGGEQDERPSATHSGVARLAEQTHGCADAQDADQARGQRPAPVVLKRDAVKNAIQDVPSPPGRIAQMSE